MSGVAAAAAVAEKKALSHTHAQLTGRPLQHYYCPLQPQPSPSRPPASTTSPPPPSAERRTYTNVSSLGVCVCAFRTCIPGLVRRAAARLIGSQVENSPLLLLLRVSGARGARSGNSCHRLLPGGRRSDQPEKPKGRRWQHVCVCVHAFSPATPTLTTNVLLANMSPRIHRAHT